MRRGAPRLMVIYIYDGVTVLVAMAKDKIVELNETRLKRIVMIHIDFQVSNAENGA